MAAIKKPRNRRWNPYQEAMIRASFRKRLEKPHKANCDHRKN